MFFQPATALARGTVARGDHEQKHMAARHLVKYGPGTGEKNWRATCGWSKLLDLILGQAPISRLRSSWAAGAGSDNSKVFFHFRGIPLGLAKWLVKDPGPRQCLVDPIWVLQNGL